jgi:hypothetical protein
MIEHRGSHEGNLVVRVLSREGCYIGVPRSNNQNSKPEQKGRRDAPGPLLSRQTRRRVLPLNTPSSMSDK